MLPNASAGRDLPGRGHERHIPRRDQGADAHGMKQRVVQVSRRRVGVAVHPHAHFGEVVEIVGGARNQLLARSARSTWPVSCVSVWAIPARASRSDRRACAAAPPARPRACPPRRETPPWRRRRPHRLPSRRRARPRASTSWVAGLTGLEVVRGSQPRAPSIKCYAHLHLPAWPLNGRSRASAAMVFDEPAETVDFADDSSPGMTLLHSLRRTGENHVARPQAS